MTLGDLIDSIIYPSDNELRLMESFRIREEIMKEVGKSPYFDTLNRRIPYHDKRTPKPRLRCYIGLHKLPLIKEVSHFDIVQCDYCLKAYQKTNLALTFRSYAYAPVHYEYPEDREELSRMTGCL